MPETFLLDARCQREWHCVDLSLSWERGENFLVKATILVTQSAEQGTAEGSCLRDLSPGAALPSQGSKSARV